MTLCNSFLLKTTIFPHSHFSTLQFLTKPHLPIFSLSCSTNDDNVIADSEPKPKTKLSDQSSWEAKDSMGEDYLYRLGKEADNMNIAVGARAGIVDDLFVGEFLGKDSHIVFDYRQHKVFPVPQRRLLHCTSLHVCHMAKNYLAHTLNTKVPLILGIWGGKGQGKSFQTELIFQAMGVEPVIMSAGELESERAGEPGKLIRERYRTASQVVQNHVENK